MHMKKYFLFALLAMFIVGCDSPNVYYPSGGNVTEMSFLTVLTVLKPTETTIYADS